LAGIGREKKVERKLPCLRDQRLGSAVADDGEKADLLAGTPHLRGDGALSRVAARRKWRDVDDRGRIGKSC
jgi:hypothetical protein